MKLEGVDSLMPYLVHLIVLYVSVGVIYLVYKFRYRSYSTATINLPPGKKGLPFIGETIDYMLAHSRGTPEKFITDRTTKYTSPDVFRTSLLGEDMAIFCGAAGNKFIFTGQNKYFGTWWPDSVNKILLDPSLVDYTSKEEVAKVQHYTVTSKQFAQNFLKPDSLQHYIPVMSIMAKQHLDQYWWSPNYDEKVIRVFPLSKKFTLALVSRLFMTIQDDELIEKLSRHFTLISNGIISMPVDLPGTAYNRAVKAGRQVRQELFPLINQKKKEILEKGKTVASDLADAMLMDGLSELEVNSRIMGAFFAGHDTTSTTLTFLISYLADYPYIYNKVLEEHMEILRSKKAGEELRWEDVQKMKYTWCVACEAMRLSPPTGGTFRKTITDFTFAGYTIPKGWKAFWTVHSTHKNPKYFPDPEKFDPSRFEGNGPAPYTFVPFGAGPKMCPGREFARLEILIFIHNLVTRFKWEKLNPNEKISYVHSPIPEQGLPIKIQPISIN